ncbi:MAG TPA: hypothetical protein PK691_10510, partial [Thermomicrobiales bacterium]|nr:hypothetical protein [Thermomicrobiales bacterium]
MKNKPSLEEGDWDFANVQEHAPVRTPRAVVSVSFNSDDLKVVADRAEALGLKTSEYIRKAALGEVETRPRPTVATIRSSGSGTAAGFESSDTTV